MIADVIIRPIVSEKSMREAEKGKFTFEVARFADKNAVKRAIEKQFSVNVTDVATSVVKGKRKRVGKRRQEVNDSVWKKATATLKSGQKINMFDLAGGAEEEKK